MRRRIIINISRRRIITITITIDGKKGRIMKI